MGCNRHQFTASALSQFSIKHHQKACALRTCSVRAIPTHTCVNCNPGGATDNPKLSAWSHLQQCPLHILQLLPVCGCQVCQLARHRPQQHVHVSSLALEQLDVLLILALQHTADVCDRRHGDGRGKAGRQAAWRMTTLASSTPHPSAQSGQLHGACQRIDTTVADRSSCWKHTQLHLAGLLARCAAASTWLHHCLHAFNACQALGMHACANTAEHTRQLHTCSCSRGAHLQLACPCLQ